MNGKKLKKSDLEDLPRTQGRPAVNMFVFVPEVGNPVGICAATTMEEAEADLVRIREAMLEAQGLDLGPGKILPRKDYEKTPHYEEELAFVARSEMALRILAQVQGVDMMMAAGAAAIADESSLTPEALQLGRLYKRLKYLEKWIETAGRKELEAYDPAADPELKA